METPGGKLSMSLHLQKQDQWTGWVEAPALEADSAALDDIIVTGDSLSFPLDEVVALSGRSIQFRGKINPQKPVIEGKIIRKQTHFYRGTITHRVTLVPGDSQRAQSLQEEVGPTCSASSQDPMNVQLVTEDIAHFWEAFDQAKPEFSPTAFREIYFGQATPGLRDFILSRMKNASRYAEKIHSHSSYYASTRQSMQTIAEMKPDIRASFFALKYLYPDAVFPDVYFVVGRMNTGGTISDCGLLVGTEIYGRTDDAPMHELSKWERNNVSSVDNIPAIVAHELAHYQQDVAPSNTLLAEAIHEGSADFISYLVTGTTINEKTYRWADKREEQLWKAFQEDMHDTDFGSWLYTQPKERPADLGYWMGFQIVQSYYQQADNKRKAVKDMLTIDDYNAFLKASGYPGKNN